MLSRLAVILDPPQLAGIAERSPWSAAGAAAILDAIQVKGRKLGNQAGTLWNALLQTEKGAGWLAKAASSPGKEGWRKASGDGVTATVRQDPKEAKPNLDRFDDTACYEEEEPMSQHIEAPALRPQELSPERKAELRTRIESLRRATRTFLGPRSADQPQAIKAFSQAWESVVRELEAMLPMQIVLQDEYRPTEIRLRSQIKFNVITALYQVIS